MNDSRGDILNQVKANRAEAVELPSLDQKWQTFDDPLAKFREMLEVLGATSQLVPNREAAAAWLDRRMTEIGGDQCISLVPGIGCSTLDLEQLDAPQQLSGLDWAVLPAEFGVAENGATWVTDHQVRHRAVYFLCEHLVLVLPASEVLHNMHQAYNRLAAFGSDDSPPFGVFIAGPSKTADIEQSLVIGAQGPRSLDVLLLQQAE